MSRPSYGNMAPQAQIANMASGVGLGTPSQAFGVQGVLDKLGVGNNPYVREALDDVMSGNYDARRKNRQADKQKTVDKRLTPLQGSFVNVDRRPFVLTCQSWWEHGRYIYCRVNPRSVSWQMNLRLADQQTLAGTVQHGWRQRRSVNRSTYFSEPVLSITFQSGNIMPVRPDRYRDGKAPRSEQTLPAGLQNFYEFMDLLDEVKLVPQKGGGRRANTVYIVYTSQLFPAIVLSGMFQPEGFSFTDTAENPNTIEWQSSFLVYDSFPSFNRANELVSSWNSGDLAPLKPEDENPAKAHDTALAGAGGVSNGRGGRAPAA